MPLEQDHSETSPSRTGKACSAETDPSQQTSYAAAGRVKNALAVVTKWPSQKPAAQRNGNSLGTLVRPHPHHLAGLRLGRHRALS